MIIKIDITTKERIENAANEIFNLMNGTSVAGCTLRLSQINSDNESRIRVNYNKWEGPRLANKVLQYVDRVCNSYFNNHLRVEFDVMKGITHSVINATHDGCVYVIVSKA